MNDLPELNNFIADLKPLFNSADLLLKSNANINKKNRGWSDLILYGFAWVNFGFRVQKTADDFNQLVKAVSNPKPTPAPIDVRVLLQLQIPALMFLNNQKLNIRTQ